MAQRESFRLEPLESRILLSAGGVSADGLQPLSILEPAATEVGLSAGERQLAVFDNSNLQGYVASLFDVSLTESLVGQTTPTQERAATQQQLAAPSESTVANTISQTSAIAQPSAEISPALSAEPSASLNSSEPPPAIVVSGTKDYVFTPVPELTGVPPAMEGAYFVNITKVDGKPCITGSVGGVPFRSVLLTDVVHLTIDTNVGNEGVFQATDTIKVELDAFQGTTVSTLTIHTGLGDDNIGIDAKSLSLYTVKLDIDGGTGGTDKLEFENLCMYELASPDQPCNPLLQSVSGVEEITYNYSANSGDIVEIDLPSTVPVNSLTFGTRQATTEPDLSEMAFVSVPGKWMLFIDLDVSSTGKLYFVPELKDGRTTSGEIELGSEYFTGNNGCWTGSTENLQVGSTNNTIPTCHINITIEPGFSPFPLSDTVGITGSSNKTIDVLRVQQRLRYLGFGGYGGELKSEGRAEHLLWTGLPDGLRADGGHQGRPVYGREQFPGGD